MNRIARIAALLTVCAIFISYNQAAFADQENRCQGVATEDVQPIKGYSGPALHRGDIFDAISEYITYSDGAPAEFCSPGPCYPAQSIVLTTCKVDDTKAGHTYGNGTIFGLSLIRSRISPTDLRVSDIFDRLSGLGVDHADASNAAQIFVDAPLSLCAFAVQSALEGNPDAVASLSNSDICR